MNKKDEIFEEIEKFEREDVRIFSVRDDGIA